MNKLSNEKRKAVVAALVEGVSINATVRLTGVSKPTILKLIVDLGCACAKLHHERVRGLTPERIQCDEIWGFVYCKAKRVAKAKAAPKGAGDCWTWTAIDPDSKLILSYLVGLRSEANAAAFMLDVADRVNNVAQLTTDGLAAYPPAVREAFGEFVDYAQLIKVYRSERPDHARYSPAECVGCRIEYIEGAPDPAHVSTSIVERSNLTMRMGMRRLTRLTNGHSKKLDNHGHAVALFFAFYNFCRPHSSLGGRTPAQAAGIADRMWSVEELIGLMA